ncbi:GGDEF domain-containing protein [Acidicapsa ligni]|uniref:GGDEF domain-containing protein n=1 Tax=Acidicapsa ligni TaxID=542300 RepID=UPI0021DF5B95|nr:GGDEF domain-containing protein [Acidicapsa ligni]
MSSITGAAKSRPILVLAISGGYLALYAATMVIFTSASDALSYTIAGFPGLAALLAGWGAARKTSGSLRLRWILLLSSIAIWTVGMFAMSILDLYLPRWPHVNTFSASLIILSLRLVIVSSPPEERSSTTIPWMDVCLTVLICTLALADTHLFERPHFTQFFLIFKVFLAGAALIVLPSLTSSQEKHFGRALCVFLGLDAISFFLNDYIVYDTLGWHHHSPFDFMICLPNVGFAILAYFPVRNTGKPAYSPRTRYIIRAAMPLFSMLAAFLLGACLTLIHPLIGFAAIGVAIVIFGLRLAVTQSQHMEAKDQLTDQTMRDHLTQIGNRGAFELYLKRDWKYADRNDDFLALLMIDVDYFKEVNDNYGHPYGDTCLVAIAQCISNLLPRTIDSVSRYGGEEFAVILPLTRLEGALIVAEKIRAAVSALPLPGANGRSLSVSIGAAASGHLNYITSPELLVEYADRALYKAKQSGRNRVEVTPVLVVADRVRLSSI